MLKVLLNHQGAFETDYNLQITTQPRRRNASIRNAEPMSQSPGIYTEKSHRPKTRTILENEQRRIRTHHLNNHQNLPLLP